MNQHKKFGATRREQIAKADRAVARARVLAACWRHPKGFSHYMTTANHHIELQAAEWLYEAAGLTLLAERVQRLRNSRDVPAAWAEFDCPEPPAEATS